MRISIKVSLPLLGFLALGAALSAATIVGVGVSAAPSWKLPIDQGLGAVFIIIVVNALLFPAVALVAFIMRRPSVFFGSLIPPLVIFAWSTALVGVDVTEIQPQLSRELKPESHVHRLIVLDNGLSECDVTCIQILARTERDIALRADDAKLWRVFRRLTGEACRATLGVDIISFVKAGYAGICAAETSQERIDDALIIRRVRHEQGDKSDFLPASFEGVYLEAVERDAGTDRLLGRWVEGFIHSRFDWMVTFFEAGPIQIAPYSKFQEFHSTVLGVDLTPSQPEEETLGDRLDALEPLLIEGAAGRDARDLYASLIANNQIGPADIIPPRIKHLLQSNDPGKVETATALLVQLSPETRIQYATDLNALLRHGDARIVELGLSTLLRIDERDLAAIKPSITDLAFSPMLRNDDGAVLAPLVKHLLSYREPFSPEARARAVDVIRNSTELSHAERRALLALIARGGTEQSAEATALIFSLTGSAFEDSVAAVDSPREECILEGEEWKEADFKRLLAQMHKVPNDRLRPYVGAFRNQRSFAPFKDELSRQIRERLAAAEGQSDSKQIADLRYLLNSVR